MIMLMVMIASIMMMMCECVQVEVSAWMNQFQPSGPQSVIRPPTGTLPATPQPPCYELLAGSDNTPCRVLGGYIWGNLLVHARVSEPSLNLQNWYVEHFGEVDDENQVIFT